MEVSNDAILGAALGGSAIGILAGLLGTWATIHAAKGPNERRLAYRCGAFGLVYITTLMVSVIIIPKPYGFVVLGLNGFVFGQVPRINRLFEEARKADLAMLTEKPKDAWPIDELA